MQKKLGGGELNSQNEVIFSNTELNFIFWMFWIGANHNVVGKKDKYYFKIRVEVYPFEMEKC